MSVPYLPNHSIEGTQGGGCYRMETPQGGGLVTYLPNYTQTSSLV